MTSLYRPHISEFNKMIDQITMRHAEDLAYCRGWWEEFKYDDGNIVQLVPRLDCYFKGAV